MRYSYSVTSHTNFKAYLMVTQAELALRSLHIEGPNLQQLLAAQDTTTLPMSFSPTQEPVSHDLWHQYKKNGLTFDEFCCIYAELKFILLKSVNDSGSILTNFISTPLKWITSMKDVMKYYRSILCPTGWFWSVPVATPPQPGPFVDVFLNGSCGKTTWRADISIPILK